MAKVRLGKDATISGAGLVNNEVRNVTINFSKAEADVSTRGGGGYRDTVGTLKECQISAEVVAKAANDFNDIRAAFESGEPQTLTFSDAGGALAKKFEVMTFDVTQELEGAIIGSVTLKTTAEAA